MGKEVINIKSISSYTLERLKDGIKNFEQRKKELDIDEDIRELMMSPIPPSDMVSFVARVKPDHKPIFDEDMDWVRTFYTREKYGERIKMTPMCYLDIQVLGADRMWYCYGYMEPSVLNYITDDPFPTNIKIHPYGNNNQ